MPQAPRGKPKDVLRLEAGWNLVLASWNFKIICYLIIVQNLLS
jgi:hypothetical protein